MASNVPGAVVTLLDAANHHDTEALLASFTQDGVVDDWGREFTGAESHGGVSGLGEHGPRRLLELGNHL